MLTEHIKNHILEHFNFDIEIKDELRHARGVSVFSAYWEGELFAFKVYDKTSSLPKDDYDAMYRMITLEREIQILRGIRPSFNNYFASGIDEKYIWILTRWWDGEDSLKHFTRLKCKSQIHTKDTEIILAMTTIVRRFCELHQQGYLHGDVQPSHIIFTNDSEVELLDFGLSRHINDTEIEYHGGLVHFNAPEVAVLMCEKAKNIHYDKLSEIYSLGSVLFYLYTGGTSTNYGTTNYKAIPFLEKLMLITSNNRNTFHSLQVIGSHPIEEILDWMMSHDRSQRCTDLNFILKKLEKL